MSRQEVIRQELWYSEKDPDVLVLIDPYGSRYWHVSMDGSDWFSVSKEYVLELGYERIGYV